jgi:hypothetical protein
MCPKSFVRGFGGLLVYVVEGINTFKRRCHDTVFLEAEPADRILANDFGLCE